MTALPLWPVERAGQALVAVAHACALSPREAELGAAPRDALATWLVEAGAWLGVEVDAAPAPYAEVARALAASAPALIHLPAGVLAVVRATRRHLIVLDRELNASAVAIDDVVAAMCAADVCAVLPEAEALAERAGLRGRDRARAVGGLVATRLRKRQIAGIFVLRSPPEATPRTHAREHRLIGRLAGVLALHGVAQLLWLASWWAVGRSVLGGMMSGGWWSGWALLLASSYAARVAVVWSSGRLGIDVFALLSRRLLAGALRTDPDALRRDGVGIAFGRVLESAALQALVVSGGLQALLAAVELVLAGVVIALGAGGAIHVGLLAATIAAGALATRGYLHARRAWTAQRLELTHGLAEAMVGQATRLAQGDLDELVEQDDRALARYAATSRAVDRAQRRLGVLIPRGWPVIAAVGLAPALFYGASSTGDIAAALGGILFAADALGRLADGATRLADASIAWRSIAELFDAAAARPDVAPPSLALAPTSPGAPALSACAIDYRHAGRGAPVLAGLDLVIERGERVRIEGASGAGKSTLARIVTGLRRPDSGLVLAGGLDRASVGASGWRRRVAGAPQFHDNHVFAGSLLFNLLMGKQWPPTYEDGRRAVRVCDELGLGPVIARMPAGPLEQVGETGWQLSHGERSRLFLARALLQGADVVVLDESLAALDPENLGAALRCIEAHAPTAIVIAHP